MNDDSDISDNPLDALSFAPSWAKGSSESQFEDIRRRAARFERDEDDGERHGHRGRRDRDDFRRDHREGGGDSRRPGGDAHRNWRDRREGVGEGGGPGGERRRDFRRDFGRGREGAPEARTPPPFSVRFLPEQEALTFLARKIAASRKAMPLRDVADLFFKAPDTTLARLEMDEEHKDDKFHQCSACGWFTRDEAELRRHLLAKHFGEVFEAVEAECEAPSGKFSSVARCGVTGKLLAPPNHHSYNRRIAEMLETPECSSMSEAEYRARIEIVSDPEAVEQWRREAAKKTLYKKVEKKTQAEKPAEAPAAPAEPAAPAAEAPAESAPAEAPAAPAEPAAPAAEAPAESVTAEAPATPAEPAAPAAEAEAPAAPAEKEEAALFEKDKAEEVFFSQFAPRLCRHSRQVTITHKASAELTDRQVLAAIRRAWDHEQFIHVSSLFFAVRAGLKARKLALFRNRDQRREEFVSFRAPTAIDPSVAVPELREVLDWVAANPTGTKAALLAALAPADAPQERQEAVRTQLAFAIDRGAVLEFSSGVLVLGSSILATAAPERQ